MTFATSMVVSDSCGMKQRHHGFSRASRMSGIEVSPIVRLAEEVQARRKAGEDILGLTTGEPDFCTPAHVCEAAAYAMNNRRIGYPPNVGTAELKSAIVRKFQRDHRIALAPDQIIVTTGAKQALYNALVATLNPGDEVIVPAPYWSTYVDIVRMCGGTTRIVSCGTDTSYLLDPGLLRAAIGASTRWVLINAPSNPTGAVYDATRQRELLEVLSSYPRVNVLSDEIYEHIVFDGHRSSSLLAAGADFARRILVVNGVSKAYAMTGWRIGYAVGPQELIAAMAAAQNQITSGACAIAQAAATAALDGPQDLLVERCASFQRRRDIVLGELSAIAGLRCSRPAGAFYVLPECASFSGASTPSGVKLQDDVAFCAHLLDFGVAVVPGSAFGAPWHFRLSFAYSAEDLREGCRRIAAAIAALQ